MTAPQPSPRINPDRLWQSLMDLAAIGATELGGVRRLALTDLDRQGRDLVRAWLHHAGCRILVDAIGNLFAIRPGAREADPVGIGSHIDTQPSGGKFDGNYGVLAGLEVIRALNDAAITTDRPIAVAVWTNEEGSRFTPVMMGSGVYAGAFSLEHCLARTDLEGVSVAQALAQIGYAGSDTAPRFAAFFEPHIEQGPILEAEHITIGAVEGALGQRWFDLELVGQDAHAGPTPLAMRRDALVGAAQVITQVRRIAAQYPHNARGTVGQLLVSPNSRNVIPGRVRLTIDLRNAHADTLAAMVDDIRACISRIAADERLEAHLTEVVHFEPCHFDPHWVSRIEALARAAGQSVRRIASGAGHDAVYVGKTCPAAMIFVPCEGGISHNEIENAEPGHLAAGAQVLLEAVLEAAGRTATPH
ncbi:MAG: Zn-dependent hydrolase [Betaproteobacteria bacterium]